MLGMWLLLGSSLILINLASIVSSKEILVGYSPSLTIYRSFDQQLLFLEGTAQLLLASLWYWFLHAMEKRLHSLPCGPCMRGGLLGEVGKRYVGGDSKNSLDGG